MDIVSYCSICGAPVMGSLRDEDLMCDVLYMTCTCGIDEDDNANSRMAGSGDFEPNAYHAGE